MALTLMSKVRGCAKDCVDNINGHLSHHDRLALVCVSIGGTYLIVKLANAYRECEDSLANVVKKRMFKMIKKVPWVKRKIDEELEKTMKELRKDVNSQIKGIAYHTEIPR